MKSMVLYPHVQKKAQAELDSVVGHRTPNFSDSDDLPYIHAIVREVLRLWPVSPLGNLFL
jgi:cytochrome P450